MRRIKVGIASFITALSLVAVGLMGAPPAFADSQVEGCHLSTCVDAYTGGKNYTNHTQWLGWVSVYSLGPASQVQTWGDGFYQQATGASRWFWVGRWVRSGTYVCGAAVYREGRQIACIGIRV